MNSAFSELQRQGLKQVDVSAALPPLKPEDVLRHLDAPQELAELGDRKQAEQGQVYVHQVVRAIAGLVVSGLNDEPWLGKLVKLTLYPHERVRQAAYLRFTHLAAHMSRTTYPLDEFANVMNDPTEPPQIRGAALLAFSYYWHPRVFVTLQQAASDPAHPAWRAVVGRLGEIGEWFTLEQFKRIDSANLPKHDAELLTKSQARLQKLLKDY